MATVTRQAPRPIRPANKPQPARPVATSPRKPAGAAAKKPASDPGDSGLFGTPPFTLIHYSPPGAGKTSMWAHMPNVGFIHDSKERGIIFLAKAKQCPAPSWREEVSSFDELMLTLSRIANKEVDIENLVIDSVTGMELLCFHYHCATYFENDWSKEGFYAYQQGPKNAAKTDWPRLLDALDAVTGAGINVVVLGHSQVKQTNNPEGADYDTYMPYLDKETWAQTHKWAKAVLFSNFDVTLQLKSKGSKKTIGTGGEGRIMYTQNNAAYIAKNLWGLEPVIDLGTTPRDSYNAFCAAYKKAWGI